MIDLRKRGHDLGEYIIRYSSLEFNAYVAGMRSSATYIIALSNSKAVVYVWSDATPVTEVKCLEYSLTIRFNLADELHSFRTL